MYCLSLLQSVEYANRDIFLNSKKDMYCLSLLIYSSRNCRELFRTLDLNRKFQLQTIIFYANQVTTGKSQTLDLDRKFQLRAFTFPNNSPKKHNVCKEISQNISSQFAIDLQCSDIIAVYSTMYKMSAQICPLCVVTVRKQTISSVDDKRHQLCSIHSVPYC